MNKFLRMTGLVLGMALVALLAVTPVLAQGPNEGTSESETTGMWERMRQWLNRGAANGESQFVDEDGDGVCDLCGGEAGAGVGMRRGLGADGGAAGACQFVDEDGDGLCDLCGNAAGNAAGEQQFVDEDGDGVCDLCGGTAGEGSGRMGGMMRGGRNR